MAVEFRAENIQTNNDPFLPRSRENGTAYSPCRLIFRDPKTGEPIKELETRAGYVGKRGGEENEYHLFVKFPDLVPFALEDELFRRRLVLAVADPILSKER